MVSYTENRRYPYPSSEREAGNGALFSELLARAVAADLDVLDAGWNGEPSKNTIITGLSADWGAFGTGGWFSVITNTVIKQVGTWGTNPAQAQVAAGYEGWYWAQVNVRGDCTGTVTTNAKHTIYLRQVRNNAGGTSQFVSERRGDVFQPSATNGCYNRMGGLFKMIAGDRIWLAYEHTNTGSTVQVKAANTWLTVTRLRGL